MYVVLENILLNDIFDCFFKKMFVCNHDRKKFVHDHRQKKYGLEIANHQNSMKQKNSPTTFTKTQTNLLPSFHNCIQHCCLQFFFVMALYNDNWKSYYEGLIFVAFKVIFIHSGLWTCLWLLLGATKKLFFKESNFKALIIF